MIMITSKELVIWSDWVFIWMNDGEVIIIGVVREFLFWVNVWEEGWIVWLFEGVFVFLIIDEFWNLFLLFFLLLSLFIIWRTIIPKKQNIFNTLSTLKSLRLRRTCFIRTITYLLTIFFDHNVGLWVVPGDFFTSMA